MLARADVAIAPAMEAAAIVAMIGGASPLRRYRPDLNFDIDEMLPHMRMILRSGCCDGINKGKLENRVNCGMENKLQV